MIQTKRLFLVPTTPQLLRWEMAHHDQLGRALNASIPLLWPPENLRDALEFFAGNMESTPDNTEWVAYYWLSTSEIPNQRVLVGSGGFKGEPDANGEVEIGYGTLDEFQGKGYATEAVNALVSWALSQNHAKLVMAEALEENLPFLRVLEKAGFKLVGAGSEPGLLRYVYVLTTEPRYNSSV